MASLISNLARKTWEGIWTVLWALGKALKWWAKRFIDEPTDALIILLVLCAVCTVGVLLSLRLTRPQTALVVAPFQLPSTTPAGLAVTGQTVASMLVDAIRETLYEGRTYEAKLVSAGPQPQPANVNLELGGLKLEGITAEMGKLRRRNEDIAGELVFGDEGALLRARVAQGPILVVGPFAPRPNELERSCQQLALKVLEESNPGIAGLVYQNRRELDEAIRLYQKWLRRESGDRKQAARAHFYLGVVYDLKGQYDEAESHYEEAVKLKRDFPEALGNLGLVLQRKSRLSDAIADYRRALDLRPDDVGTLVNLGAALSQQGKFEDSIEMYRKAVRLDPTTPALRLGLAGALRKAGHEQEAELESKEADRLSGTGQPRRITKP